MNLQDENGEFLPMLKCCEDCCGHACCNDAALTGALKDEDKWIMSRVNDATRYITDTMERYDLALAGQRAYDLIWNEFFDWYIEEALKEKTLIEGCISRGLSLEETFEEHKKLYWTEERAINHPYRAYKMNTEIIIKMVADGM